MALNKILDIFRKKPPVEAAPAPQPKKAPKTQTPKAKSPKEIATEAGEPWVDIISLDVDPENLHQGAFELDWNDKFVSNLIRAGYKMDQRDTDADIVDRWFQNVCRNVVLETYEQYEAMSGRVVKSRDVGGGRSEVS